MPIAGPAADRDLVPEYPGITDSDRVADWDPPFPIDLKRVRPIDEEYWNRYRATPKAFIPIERGQQLWSSRHGALTALRLVPPEGMPLAGRARAIRDRRCARELDPLAMGFSVYDVRAQGLAASSGATDFGEYFTYFSTFLVVSALLLAGLFFKLGVEQRLQEVGLLQALGLDPAGDSTAVCRRGARPCRHRRRCWASPARSPTARSSCSASAHGGSTPSVRRRSRCTSTRCRSSPAPLAVVLIAVASIWWSLRALATASTRSLLRRGQTLFLRKTQKATRPLVAAIAAGVDRRRAARRHRARRRAARRRILWRRRTVARRHAVPRVGLAAPRTLGRAPRPRTVGGVAAGLAQHGVPAGAKRAVHRAHRLRDLRHRRGRSVQARRFRHARSIVTRAAVDIRCWSRRCCRSCTISTTRPGRDAMNLPAAGVLQGVRFDRFRVRPGDDTSCLNLYQPKNPRIVAATQDFINSGPLRLPQLAGRDRPRSAPTRGCCSTAISATASFPSSPTPTR